MLLPFLCASAEGEADEEASCERGNGRRQIDGRWSRLKAPSILDDHLLSGIVPVLSLLYSQVELIANH